jgi:hypothetical protein
MKPPPPFSPQLHLPLLSIPATVIPPEKQSELVFALVELLIGAAHTITPSRRDGGIDECQAHR